MKSALLTASLLILCLAGCSKESPPGGPGAAGEKTGTTTPGGGKAAASANDKNTFTLKVPSTGVNVTQGEEKEVTLSIDRGSDFKQKVALKFEAPAGLTVTPETASIAPDDKDVKVLVIAAADAKPGTAGVTVKATPETGKDVSESFNIDIKAK